MSDEDSDSEGRRMGNQPMSPIVNSVCSTLSTLVYCFFGAHSVILESVLSTLMVAVVLLGTVATTSEAALA